jgi:magnesium-transporting ATPase (P-type)
MSEVSATPGNNEWYRLPVEKVEEIFSTSSAGLASAAAEARLGKYGYNELKFKKQSALIRFLLQFRSALIYVLLAAALVTAILEMWVDSAVIFVVVIANAIIGFIQEGKAEASMEVLSKMMVLECTVLRDGERRDIPARQLVPGDVVLLEEGDRVPADLRLFYVKNLSVDEAPLTGESVPVEKTVEPVPRPNLAPGDQRCMAFSGTFAARGSAQGIVVATGMQTEIGKIATLMKETKSEAAPLIRKMAQFTKFLIIAIMILAAINLVLGATLGGYDLVYSFLASVSLAVAAIPEGLPAILTIALASGARAMARRNALVRRLPAVETLGSATVICSDKTGTLTRNEMTVVRVYCGNSDYAVTGAGYEPRGEFTRDGRVVDPQKEVDLAQTLRAGYLCNDAALYQTDDSYEMSGDPTEGALVVSATKAGVVWKTYRLDEIPFGSEHRYMAVLQQEDDRNVIYVKGSPEKIIAMCSNWLVDGDIQPMEPDVIRNKVSEMGKGALRVLGLAYRSVPSNQTSLSCEDLEDMTFLGLQGMIDPPREEAVEAVRRCRRAGIKVVMVTGDHAQTAQAVAEQLGIPDERVLIGEDLSGMSDDELYDIVDQVCVFARVAPVHKYRVATQLEKRGHIVAMTGDGVNDAPALKAADIGVAMGLKGTDVSREAADMVLVDDNFASIVAAVEEGRHVYENIRKVILYTLATNGGQGLLVLSAILTVPFVPLFAERLPLEPIHILWINLYDAVFLALPLLWEPKEKGLLARKPRDPREPIADRLFFRKILLVSIIMAGAAFAIFYQYGNVAVSGSQVDEVRLGQAQTAAFVTVMMVHVFYLLASRSLTRSAFKMNPFSNKWVWVGIGITVAVQLVIVYALPHAGINPLRTEPIPAEWWIFIILLALPGLFLVELEDFVAARLRRITKKT